MKTPVTVVILAAGLGTRMKSRKAKVLHRAGGKSLLQHVVDTALTFTPPERIFVVVGHQAAEVRRAITTPGIGFIEQTEQRGTGHAVMVGRPQLAGLGGYLMVLYGDCPLLRSETLQELIAAQSGGDGAATLMTAYMEDPTGYGRVLLDDYGRVSEIVEQKAASPEQLAIREANMGIYCFRADLFWKHVDELGTSNPANEYYLTDMAAILTRAGYPVEVLRINDAREALGINDRMQLAEVDTLLRARTGGTRTCEVRIEKFRSPARSARRTDMAFAGAVVSNPTAKNTTCLEGHSLAIVTASSGEYTTRTSPPRAFAVRRSTVLPGTRSMSPKEQTMAP